MKYGTDCVRLMLTRNAYETSGATFKAKFYLSDISQSKGGGQDGTFLRPIRKACIGFGSSGICRLKDSSHVLQFQRECRRDFSLFITLV